MTKTDTLREYLGVAKTIYGDYFREIKEVDSFLLALIKFVLVIITLPISFPVMIAIIHLVDTGNSELYDQMKNGNKDNGREADL